MNRKNFIQVFEYEKLRIDEKNFTETHLNALVKFNEKNGNKYFTTIYKGVQFKSYVGVIQIGGLTIEILPKADNSTIPNKKLWQNILLNMLMICKHINIDSVSETGLKKKNNSILELYFEIFLNEVENLIKRGLIKRYKRVEKNEFSLKGKMILSKNIAKNLTHKERFYCEHQIFNTDHKLHQILLHALKIVESAGAPDNVLKDKVKKILLEFDNITPTNLSTKDFQNIHLDRKSASYKKSVDIAKMLILNYLPSLNSGNEQMLTLLFDMNKLWEDYIFRVLRKHINQETYHITAQSRNLFWRDKTIRPDIVITNHLDNETFIIDTKWKIVDNSNPSDDDLKQMFTYNLHWKSRKSILLYPKINQNDSTFGNYTHNPIHKIEDDYSEYDNQCKVGFISLIDEYGLRSSKELCSEIMMKFLQN